VKIEVLYTCSLCGVTDAKVKLEERRPAQDLDDWMAELQAHLVVDHMARSPGCTPKTLAKVKIPYVGGKVGETPRN
jgi:hypothetical protein